MGNDRERIGKRISRLRMEAGISQYKLADLTEYSTGIDLLSKIGDALGYELDFVRHDTSL